MNRSVALRLFVLTSLVSVLAAGAWAQATTSLRGVVTDPSGAVVPGAKLALTNVGTSAMRQDETDASGNYLFAALPPATYRLRIEASGFKAQVREGIVLQVNVPVTMNVALEIGRTGEVVVVTAEAPTVNTTDATIGNVINRTQISQLPLEARSIMSLLSLQTGVTFVNNTDTGVAGALNTGVNDYRNGAVNGAKPDQINVTLDGVDANDQLNGLVNGGFRITAAALQEFRMVTSNPTSTQGRSSGAQVSMVTNSGTNEIHGSLYEFHRNTRGTANDWFLNAARADRRKYLKNIFGVSLGGPILKDRFFGFFNYEGRRDRQEFSTVRNVPSADLRNGILSYKNNQGGVTRLTPDQVAALDPARIGPNPAVLAVFKQYPLPNEDTVGDSLNNRGFRFKAPAKTDFDTWIARFDYRITSDSRHTLFWRGNLQADTDSSAPQFPGQGPRFNNLNNSRASALGYTAVLKPNLVNDLRWGFARQGQEAVGASFANATFFRTFDDLSPYTRSNGRKLPTHNIVEDMTWTKGKHTLNFGGNLRWIRRESFNLGNSFHTTTTNSSWLIGTGRNLRAADVASTFRVSMSDAMMAVLGIQAQANGNYNYDKTGALLPIGSPVKRRYGANEYEWYIQDSWKWKSNVTVTVGVRHSLFSPPWETNGNQVAPSFSLGGWFDLRGANMLKGIPSNQAPRVTYDLAGPANGKKGFYNYDKNNFAPRVAIAYSPGFNDGWLKRIFGGPGKTSIRAGYSIAYDHVGAGLANTFDQGGASFGLGSVLQNPSSTVTEITAPRFTALNVVPTSILVPAPPGGFPNTPRSGGYLITNAIDDTIKTPYAQMLAFSIQRQLPKDFTLEVGYVGRLSRKLLIQDDLAMSLDLVDPATGMTYFQAANLLVDMYLKGTPVAQVPKIAYWENLFPKLATNTLTATQNAYREYGDFNAPDYTSALNDIDVICSPACGKFGAYAYFNDQFADLAAWRSRATGNYHALQVMLRKRFSMGLTYDLNFTWSKSIDWASSPERAATYSGFTINAWSPGLRRSVSDYDLTRQLNMNGVYQLPFGKGKTFASGTNGVVDAIIGGWQLGGIYRHTSGLPTSVGNGRFWPTNWNITGFATATSGFPATETTKNAPSIGGPNLFANPTQALKAFANTRPGQIGDRNQIRGDGLFNIDLSLGKTWKMPYKEGHTLQFRWEVFNVTNSVRFDVNSLTLDLGSGAAAFGKYSGSLTQSRVQQFGLRYEF